MAGKKKTEADAIRMALQNCYRLAQRKRAMSYTYPPDGGAPIRNGPRSHDADWDHIIRFCEEAGLKPTIIRTKERSRDN